MAGSGGPDHAPSTDGFDRRNFLRLAGGTGIGTLAGLGAVPTAGAAGGDERWRFETGAGVSSSPTVVDETVYVGSDDGTVYALDADRGTELWRHATDSEVFSSPAVTGGTVYVGSTDNQLYALDAGSGEQRWRFDTHHDVQSSPTVADGTVVVGGWDGSVFGVDAETGEEQWRFGTGGLVYSSPTVEGGTAYVGSWGGYLYALDVATGDLEWEFDTRTRVYSSPTVADGTVYFGNDGNNVVALDAESGEGQWAFSPDGSVRSSPTVADGTVYVGSRDHRVYALDAESGEQQWRVDAGERVESSPTIAGGTVIVGTAGNELRAFDAESGEGLWQFDSGDDVRSSPTVVDGTAYVGSTDGNLYAVDAGVEGDSEGSRVRGGTLGHHHAWAGEGAVGDSSGVEVSIENLRLVQTVENTRVLVPRDERSGTRFGQESPVAEDLFLEDDHDDILWTAPDPPFVTDRELAPVFDLAITDYESVDQPATVRGRLVRDGDTRLERTARVRPAALRGENEDRRDDLESLYSLDVPDRLPLLEMLSAEPDLIDGEYPTLPTAGGHEVEVEVEAPQVEGTVSDRVSIDPDRTATMPTLTIGIVPLERPLPVPGMGYGFDGDPEMYSYAEGVANYVLNTFPVTNVEIAVTEQPIPGPAIDWAADIHQAALMVRSGFSAMIDAARTFRLSDGGERLDDIHVGEVDVTLGVVPEDGFFQESWWSDLWGVPGGRGTHPVLGGLGPTTAASLAEIGHPTTAAHEIAHYFLGSHYDDHPALSMEKGSEDSPPHASKQMWSTGYVHRDGSLEVRPGKTSVMSYTGDSTQWSDAHMYRGLVESDFRAFDSWSSAESAASFDAGTRGRLAEAERHVARAQDAEGVPAVDDAETDLETLRSSTESFRSDLDDGLAATDEHWETPDTLDADQWERLRDVGERVATIGEQLSAADSRYLPEAETTTASLGSRLIDAGTAMTDRAETRLSEGITHVLQLVGEAGESADPRYETLPVVEPPEPFDGDGSVTVRDANGEVLADRDVTTELSVMAQDGSRQEIDGAVFGTVPLPAQATAVEVSAETDAVTISTTMNPTVDPIAEQLEALRDRAFDGDLARSEVLDRLDRIGTLAAEGDHENAAEAFESLYRDLHDSIPGDYAPESAGEPTKDRVLALVGQQLQRFGGDVPDLSSGSDDLPRTWLAAGAAGGGLLGTYALKRAWDRRGDRSSEG